MFQEVRLPKMRRTVSDIGWLTHNRYLMRGLMELDVTQSRQFIRDHKVATGESLSFTAYLISCVGHAVDADKSVHAVSNWRGHLVIFDEVDVGTTIEREVAGVKYPSGHIVRAANKKTFRAIHDEIRASQARPEADEAERMLRFWASVPRPARRLSLWYIERSPKLRKQTFGTVALSAVGMFGHHSGWGIAPGHNSLGLLVGGIATKPALIDGRVEPREYLCLTLEFDHAVVDGAPAARFAQRLADLIESGYGMGE